MEAQTLLQPHIVQTVKTSNATSYGGSLRFEDNQLVNISSGDWFSINTGDLGVGVDTIILRFAKADTTLSMMEIRQGSPTGPLIAEGNVPSTGGWDIFRNKLYTIDHLNGESELFFLFTGEVIGTIDKVFFGRSQRNLIHAEQYHDSFGVVKTPLSVTGVSSGDWLQFKDVRLGNGYSQMLLRFIKPDSLPLEVTLHKDSLDGPIISKIDLPSTQSQWNFITGELNGGEGTHDIFAKFTGSGEVSEIDFISFYEQPVETKLTLADAYLVRGMSYIENMQFLKIEPFSSHWFSFSQTSVSYNPKIEFKYANGGALPMTLEVRKYGQNGQLLATLDLPSTGSYDNFQTISTRLTNRPQGTYTLAFKLVGDGDVHIGDINLIRIDGVETPPLGSLTLDNIVVDQFGYTPEMEKLALIRDGEVGFGALDENYIPGTVISLVDSKTQEVVFSDAPTAFQFGATDPLSGDRVWTFDFSTFATPGTYYIYDADNSARSANFEINENVYKTVLREAFRTFIYQRSGFEKTADIVGEAYVDEASHIGPRQDIGARVYNNRRLRSSERDLSGGWYDAGDFKKYSNWTADYILGLLHAYHANPEVWPDDWNLPDSGNGIPDILDEVRWGVEHLQRMQETADETGAENVGAVLSVVDSDNRVSPPSANIENSFYGPVSTSATYTSAGAFAYAATTFETLPDQAFQDLAETLSESAISAYQWAENNPDVRFNNAENGVGNGNSEVTNDYFLDAKHRIAAIYLYGLTQDESYKTFVETDFTNSRLITTLWASPYEVEEPTALLHYAKLDGITPEVGTQIEARFNTVMETAGNGRPALEATPYRAFIQEYVWGSNKFISRKGDMYAQLVSYDIGERPARENLDAAAGYLHYIHGVNPLGKVFLTNMNGFGAENSVDEMYHAWFGNDTPWDNVNTSFGPPPGYLVGGPNQNYGDNGTLEIDQPPMKSYIETNAYLNNERSWELTENSNGYQIEYLKLLSKFVK